MTEWLNTIVGEAVAPYATLAIALVVVLILIALFFRLIKAMRSGAMHGGQRNRLSIVEAATLEGKRRLVLVRRDDVEHLILIGGENDVVVEHNIVRRQADPARASAPRTAPQPQPAPALATAAAAQRPAVQAPLPTAPMAKPSEPRQSLTETRSAPPAPIPAPVPTYGSAPAPASAPPAPNATPVVASAVPAAVASTPVAAAVIVPSVSATGGSVANNPTAAPYDSARIDQDMNRLLDQLAGD